jgi:hypothetical protein
MAFDPKNPAFEAPELIESPFELIQTILDDTTIKKVCELLNLDPETTNSITIEASGAFKGKDYISNVLTIRRLK